MANGMNKVILIGNIGQTPELRHTNSGTAVMSLRLATNERAKINGEWTDTVEWHTVVIWDKRAEGLAKVVDKGAQLCIEGRLQTRKWQTKDGDDRYTTEVVARDVILLGRGKGDGSDRRPPPPEEPAPQDYSQGGFADDEIPF